jgi:hypothetical protein
MLPPSSWMKANKQTNIHTLLLIHPQLKNSLPSYRTASVEVLMAVLLKIQAFWIK